MANTTFMDKHEPVRPGQKAECGCLVTVHRGECVYHVHDWAYDYYYQDNPSDDKAWCKVCHKTMRQIREEEAMVREQERQRIEPLRRSALEKLTADEKEALGVR